MTSCWQAICRTRENQAEQSCYPCKNCVSVVFVDFTGNRNQAEQYFHPCKNCVLVVFVDFTGNVESTASLTSV